MNVLVSEVWRYHVVRRGETAYRIALRYGISVTQLKELNRLRNYNIAAGTRLKVGKIAIASKSDPIQTAESKESAEAESIGDVTPIVNPGKSQTKITPTTENINNPKPNSSNQNTSPIDSTANVIKAPKVNTALTNQDNSVKVKYHKVQPGQTLFSISKAYGMDVATLKRLNGLRSNKIEVGRLLRIR